MDASITHIRPRFSFELHEPQPRVLQRVQQALNHCGGDFTCTLIDNHLVLDIPINERHYWSPQLSLRIEEDELDENVTHVKGLIGPRPAVWTLFVFFYFAIGTLGLLIAIYGFSIWMLGEFSHYVWALPVAFAINLTAYRAGKIGERLGHDQVEILKNFVRGVLNESKVATDATATA